MSKLIHVILCVALLAGVLAACAAPAAPAPAPAPAQPTAAPQAVRAQPTAAPTPIQPPAAAQKVLEYWAVTDEPDRPFQQMIVDEFNKANPDIKIVWRPNQVEDFKTALPVAIASGKPPDIFYNWSGDTTARLARQGNLLELTPYIAKYGWDKSLGPAPLSAFTQDGKLWGMPWSFAAKYFFYNKNVFAKNNLDLPKTFGDLLKLCGTLKGKGLVPLAFGNKEKWEAPHYVAGFNQRVVGEKTVAQDYALAPAADKLFADPLYVKSLDTLVEMQKAGCFPDAVNSVDSSAMWAQFYTEKAAMIYEGTWAIGIFKQNSFENYGMFRMPPIEGAVGDQNTVLSGFDGLEVSAKTPYPDAAVKFLDFYVSKEMQRKDLEMAGGRLPVRADAVDPATASWQVQFVVADVAKASGSASWLDTSLDQDISQAYLNGIQELLGGTKKSQQVMDAVHTAAVAAKAKLKQ